MGGKFLMVLMNLETEKVLNTIFGTLCFVSQLAVSPENILAGVIIYFLCLCIFPWTSAAGNSQGQKIGLGASLT